MRAVKRALLAILRAPYYGRLLLGRTARAVYHRLPLSYRNKQRLKSFVYRNFGFLIKNTARRQALAETMRRNIAAFSYRPLISILMPTYNVAPVFLAKAIESIREQAYPFWELCICDDGSTNVETVETLNGYAERDGRIKLLLSKENRGISAATNAVLEIAGGDFIAMLDHDDELTPDALYEIASALNEAPETDAVYSDSDKIDADGVLSEPFYKPDWSLELFRGVMYIAHLLVVRRALAKKAGGFDTRYDKVQDFELMLRVSEATDRIRHIPKILYHWRKISGSVAYGLDEKSDISDLQVAAVNAHLERCGVAASACAHPTIGHRVVIKPKPRKTWPLVSIIIPSKDAPCHIGRCLQSIFTRTTYQDIEVIVVDNGTTDPQALAYLHQYPLKIVSYNEKFNFSRANNLGIAEARGEYVVLLNNDTEIVIPEWIEVMLFHMELPNVGAVGPLLLYPDKTVQHAGVVLGFRGTADHVMRGFPGDADGYAGSLSCTREVTAVTAACMMMRRDEYIECGGLLEYYATHYQDLDLCLRFFSSGKRILYTPRAVLIHHESVSRGQCYDSLDRALIIDTWGDLIKRGDPYYNPNFTLTRCDYTAL